MAHHSCFSMGRRLRVWLLGVAAGAAGALAAEVPGPPASPLSRLVQRFAEKKPAAEQRAQPPRPEDLVRPEFRFRPGRSWLFLPTLAERLSTNEAERAAVFALLDQGVTRVRELLAAHDAEHDVVAATALFVSQLWGVVRQQEVPEAHTDALHAQLAAALAGSETGTMGDADKQSYWEFCLGFPVFVLGMAEVITEPEAQADLRRIAAAGFKSLIGVDPEKVDLGPTGLVVRAGLEATRESGAPPAPSGTGAAIPGITYTAPTGWDREEAGWATIYRATLGDVLSDGRPDPNGEGRHAASLFVLPPRPAAQGPTAAFEAAWREQFSSYELGDTIVHYRSRVPSGLVVHFMGRFFQRLPVNPDALREYGVLYLFELSGDRVQPLVAIVVPTKTGLGPGSMFEGAAYQALGRPLGALLDSVRPAGGAAPRPAGGLFSPEELQGNWTTTSSAFGGFYVNTVTGAGAGAAVHTGGGKFRLGKDGTYSYSFAFASTNPMFGTTSGSTSHSGRYRLDGDIVLVEPSKPISYTFTCCAVGVGRRQTAGGWKRILVTVSATTDGVYRAPPLIPDWGSYSGTMNWYLEE